MFGEMDAAAYCQKSTIPTVNHGCGNIMVCGCFSYSGTEEIIIIGNTMKPANNIKILEDCLESYVRKLEPVPAWMFQQDIDPKHIAKVTHAWFEENNIKVIKWLKLLYLQT